MEAVSGGPADWLRQLADNLTVDPGLPQGVCVMRSGIDQVISVTSGGRYLGEHAVSDLLAEEYRSLGESEPYIVRYAEQGEPIACEICGTRVALMPEREGLERPWKPGIWECTSLRRHTLRRCEWKRANP